MQSVTDCVFDSVRDCKSDGLAIEMYSMEKPSFVARGVDVHEDGIMILLARVQGL
jgi:hypothetical protein